MLMLSASQIRRTLPMPAAIDAMKRAFLAISAGDAEMPLRTHIDSPDGAGTTLVMPALVRSADTDSLTVKVVSIFAGNPDRGLPRILATVLAVDPHTGEPIALMDGTTITAVRTAAASAAATDALARL